MKFIFLSCLFVFSSCVSSRNDSLREVIEKSKAEAPVWAEEESGIWKENLLQFHFSFTKVLDLQGGVKQSQLHSLDQSKDLITSMLGQAASDISSSNGIELIHRDELDKVISSEVRKSVGDKLRIGDIYFEKIRATNPGDIEQEYYDVFVLVTFEKSSWTETVRQLSSQLKESNHHDLRQVADRFNSTSSLLSH